MYGIVEGNRVENDFQPARSHTRLSSYACLWGHAQTTLLPLHLFAGRRLLSFSPHVKPPRLMHRMQRSSVAFHNNVASSTPCSLPAYIKAEWPIQAKSLAHPSQIIDRVCKRCFATVIWWPFPEIGGGKPSLRAGGALQMSVFTWKLL